MRTIPALILALLAASLGAGGQAPPAAPASHKRLIFAAAAAGAAAGALVGTRGLSFAQVAAAGRGANEARAGLVYGAIGGLVAAAVAASFSPESPEAAARHFWWNRSMTPLLAGIAVVQTLDYTSTRYFRDRGKNEYLLTNQLVDDKPAFIATEIGAGAAGVGLCYLLHRSGHDGWARAFAAGYTAIGAASAVANYRYPATGHGLF